MRFGMAFRCSIVPKRADTAFTAHVVALQGSGGAGTVERTIDLATWPERGI